MIVGVTGTRHPISEAQLAALQRLLFELVRAEPGPLTLLHGGCTGADLAAAQLAVGLKACCNPPPRIVCRPGPPSPEWTADPLIGDKVWPPESHFARNRRIVTECNLLLVVPHRASWEPRGGTWYTHDHAVKRGKPLRIIWPDGTVVQGLQVKQPATDGG